jgi:hypothetical protein
LPQSSKHVRTLPAPGEDGPGAAAGRADSFISLNFASGGISGKPFIPLTLEKYLFL